jgi:NhaP-type Na+/H+ or K+/H+ antiporter
MLTTITLVLLLGVVAIWAAWRMRLPSILVLLAVGLLVGPVARWISLSLLGRPLSLDPSSVITPRALMDLVGLSIGLILFEGGLTLNWREIADVRRVVLLLVTVGAAVTWCLTSLAAHYFLGLEWRLALLLAAVLVVTGPTVVGPLLRFIRPAGKAGPVLRWEGITIDPVGAMAAVLVFEVIASQILMPASHSPGAVAAAMVRRALITSLVGAAIGLGAALVLVSAIRRHLIPDHLHIPVTLAFVVCAFGVSNALAHDAGLFATTILGIVMANQRHAPVRHILEFKENITTLLIAILFILLAARVDLASLVALNGGVLLFLAALVLVVRPASVLLSTLGSALSVNERLFICWMAPRGIVAASVASLFALRLEQLGVANANVLVTYTFLVVIATVALYGLTAAHAARALGLARRGQRGFLVVGADPFARGLARFLADEGLDVLLVDTNTHDIVEAGFMGLPVALGNALSSDVLERVELSPLGHLLALTSNDEVNAMAAVQFGRVFGRQNVYQLAESPRHHLPSSLAAADKELVGRVLFAPDLDHATLRDWLARGARIRKTRLTDRFTYRDYLDRNGPRARMLMIIKPTGIKLLTPDARYVPEPGDQIVSLVLPEDPILGDAPGEPASAGGPRETRLPFQTQAIRN